MIVELAAPPDSRSNSQAFPSKADFTNELMKMTGDKT